MKKIALFVALAMIAASPAMAAKKKAKRVAAEPQMTDWQQHNDNGYRFFRDALPIWLPSWSMPIYMGIKNNQAAADARPANADVKPAKRRGKRAQRT